MFEPGQRRLLTQSLRPPAGYDLDILLGTTFSLDLEALLMAPLAFTMFDWDESDANSGREPLALIESLRRYASRLTIFCQGGQVNIPKRNQPLLASIEESVVQVFAPKVGGLFHPKVWIVRFRGRDANQAIRYRVLVMSRNLTLSTSWDAMVALDGELVERQKAFSANHPLADFVAALPGLAPVAPSPRVVEHAKLLQDELRRVRFDLPEGVELFGFKHIGLSTSPREPFKGWTNGRSLVVSPFLGEEWLKWWLEGAGTATVVSREEELLKLSRQMVESVRCFYVGIPQPTVDPQEDAQDEGIVPSDLVELHAKMFAVDEGWNARLMLGSANATDGAFDLNVEFMIELQGKKSVLGVDALVDPDNQDRGFGQLLMPYAARQEQGRADPSEELRNVEQRLRTDIARASVVGTIEPSSAGEGKYSMQLKSTGPWPAREGVQLRVWPVTMGEAYAQAIPSDATAVAIRFDELSTAQLTAFLAVDASLAAYPNALPIRFVLRIPVDGFPADRADVILRSLLSEPASVARYLGLLLSLDEASGSSSGLGLIHFGDDIASGKWGDSVDGLLETFLTVLSEEPKRLEYVDSFLKSLGPTGSEMLPPAFQEVWDAFRAAALEPVN